MLLEDVLPDEDYRFQFRFKRASRDSFFHPTPEHGRLIAERREWLQRNPESYAGLLPEGIPLLRETLAFAKSTGAFPELADASANDTPALNHGTDACLKLGEAWEPDFLLLRPDASGRFQLVAGCVCFPSSWSLPEKMGRPLEEIHDVVPGLNSSIGRQIHGFLSKLGSDTAWLRSNWGLTRSPELNQHPGRKLPRLDDSVSREEVWLRVEYQALVSLPQTAGVLFGIRLAIHPLGDILREPEISQRLSRALKTMPEPVAQYKGIAAARARLVSFLG
jgi:hypothetical protein